MNLTHVVASLQREHGGPSRSVRALCGALASSGEQVTLLTTHPTVPGPGETELAEPGLTIRTFHRDWPQRLCPSRGLRRALAEGQPAVVHHHGLWLRTLHYASRGNAPLVVSPRGMMSRWAWHHHRTQKALASWFLHPGAWARVAGWHATSEQEAEEIRALGFRQPVCVSPNGVDAPAEATIADARQFWTARGIVEPGRKWAVFYGRLHRKKRVQELIDVWARISMPGWGLLIVGIPEEYGVSSLETYAARSAPSGCVRVFDGNRVPAPYAVASLFLLPSHNENFGLTVAEALAHGVPVVVTDTTPWSGLNAREAGWCVPWAEFGAATEAALRLSDTHRGEFGERGRRWILADYSWASAASRLVPFYRQLGETR